MTTIAEIVSQSGDDFDGNNQDFDILLKAVQTADLVDALNDLEADLTAFAPTDAAFTQLAQDLGFEGSDEAGAFDAIVATLTELGEGDPVPLLRDILLYHVSPEAKTLETIQGSDSVSTLLEGATLTPNGNSLEDNEPDLIDPSFVEGLTDIEAENGVVQAIDRVLIPLDIPGNEPAPSPESELTIAEIVAQSGDDFDENNQDFDILLEAVQTADLVDALNDSEADLTAFAPTDAAFTQLAQDLGFEGSDEAGAFDAIVAALTELGEGDPVPLLKDILLYHVSPEAKTLETIQGSDSISTLLEGATLTPNGNSLEDNEPDLIDPSFVEGLTDIEAENGVVQAIDRVLIPLDIPGNEEEEGEVLRGGRGDDIQDGGQGNDTLIGNRGDDIQNAKGGDDLVRGGRGDDIQNGGQGNDTVIGNRGDDIQHGRDGDDLLRGGRGDDFQRGGDGADLLRGGRGDDIQKGGQGDDSLRGGRGDDFLIGGAGADNLRGGFGNDILLGGKGHDQVFGGAGDDVLIGGLGNDTVTGGHGEDSFVLAPGGGRDQIIDFNLAEDSMSLAGDLTFEDITVSQGVGNQASSALISITETGDLLAVVENVEAETLNRGVFDEAMI